ncbi:MAG: CoA transferase [Holophagales bacterium]|nr:CoA transferase [Holophagales bacterium]MYH26060.1 CoA transferase [Holophagales bacterium]
MNGSQPGPPLAGVRVVELTDSVAAAYCARQFALWGADVVVLEREGGSRLRRMGPHGGEGAARESLLWQFVAANKRAMALSSACPDADALLEVLRRADVLVTDWADADLERWGLTLDGLRERLPGLVLVSVSPFGLDGPYAGLAGSELVVQALSGYAFLNGDRGRAPLKAPGHILGYACGVSAFVAAVAALIARLGNGRGSFVEASEMETLTAILPLLRIEYTGVHPERDGGPSTGVRAHRCRDGWVTFVPPPADQLGVYGAALGVDDGEWPRSVEGEDPVARVRRLLPFLAGRVREKTMDELFHGLLERKIVCGKVVKPVDLLAEEHLAARGFFQTLRHPRLGELPFAGPGARLGLTDAVPPAHAPAVREQVEPSALDWQPIEPPAGAGEQGESLPLADVEIVDLTQAWIGPFATMLLADLGASVIKVESHHRPDVWRRWLASPVPMANPPPGLVNSSPNYNSVNRNKRSLCLDLKTEEGKDLLRRLAAGADVVMENFTPRVMERFGLEWPELSAENPGLVMTHWSGFGKTGPLSDYKANGTSIEALAGWDWLHRYPGGDPMVMGFYQADAITGMQMAATTLVALFHSRRTGEGQSIDGSMIEAAVGYLGEVLLDAALGGEQTPPGNGDLDLAPHGVYPCVGDDRWIAVAVESDEMWCRLVAVSGSGTLADPVFDRHADRIASAAKLDEAMAEWTGTLRAEHLMERLQAAGIGAGVVRTTAELMACPHLEQRRWFRRIEHADVGEHRYAGHPWRIDGLLERSDLPPPRLGEHSRELLRERLGLSDAEIDGLFERSVTGAVLS